MCVNCFGGYLEVFLVYEVMRFPLLVIRTNHIRIPIAYYSCLLQSLLEEFSSAQGILYQSDFNHLVLKNALLFLPVSYSLLNDPIKIEDELTRQSIFTFVKNNKEALMESFKRVVKRCESNPQRVVFFGDIVSEMILPFSENKNDCDRMWMLLQSIWKVSVTNRNDEDFCYPYTFYRYLVSLLVNDVDLFKQYSRIITTSDDDVWGSDEMYQYLLSMYTMYNEVVFVSMIDHRSFVLPSLKELFKSLLRREHLTVSSLIMRSIIPISLMKTSLFTFQLPSSTLMAISDSPHLIKVLLVRVLSLIVLVKQTSNLCLLFLSYLIWKL